MKLGKETAVPIVAVSADGPEGVAKMQAKVPGNVKLFSDSQLVLADALGLRHQGGNPMTGTDIFRPAKLQIDPAGRVLQIEVRDNYRVR